MVKPQRIDKPLPKESEAQPELTGLDQLTEQERARIEARKAGAGQAPRTVAPPSPEQLLDHTDRELPMTRRSWYVTKAAADALAEAVDDIHHITRGVPKHVIASLMFEIAAQNADAVAGELGRRMTSRSTRDTGDTK